MNKESWNRGRFVVHSEPLLKPEASSILRFVAQGGLIAVAFLNLWHSNRLAESMKARADDDVVVIEQQMIGVRNKLLEVNYRGGDLGYIPAAVLNGETRNQRDEVRFVQARYVMIPWNLLEDSLTAPYLIVDSSTGNAEFRMPEGFAKIYDSGEGMILFQKAPTQ